MHHGVIIELFVFTKCNYMPHLLNWLCVLAGRSWLSNWPIRLLTPIYMYAVKLIISKLNISCKNHRVTAYMNCVAENKKSTNMKIVCVKKQEELFVSVRTPLYTRCNLLHLLQKEELLILIYRHVGFLF